MIKEGLEEKREDYKRLETDLAATKTEMETAEQLALYLQIYNSIVADLKRALAEATRRRDKESRKLCKARRKLIAATSKLRNTRRRKPYASRTSAATAELKLQCARAQRKEHEQLKKLNEAQALVDRAKSAVGEGEDYDSEVDEENDE